MLDTVELEIVNTRVANLYGRHTESEKPLFRVAWAPNEYETRFGIFSDFDDNEIFIREIAEIRTVPKYPWLGDQYLVEKLTVNTRKDVYEGDYIYEPLWPFPEGLPLKWEGVELCIKKALGMIPDALVKKIPKSEKEAIEQDNIRKEKEKQVVRDMIDSTALETSLHDGSAVSYAGIEIGEDDEQSNGS